jgi:hypothetical protein
MTETLRAKLEEHRNRLKELSKASGLDYAVLWRWLHRERQIFGDTADKLAQHFGLTLVSDAQLALDLAGLKEARHELAMLRRYGPKNDRSKKAAANVSDKLRSRLPADTTAPTKSVRSLFRGDRGKCERCAKRRLICASCKLCDECGHGPTCKLSPLRAE